jgi:hypothetical protein
MAQFKFYCALAAVFALGACNMGRTDSEDDGNSSGGERVSAEGKAEEGKIKFHGPGVDFTFKLPKEVSGQAKAAKDSKLLYPGSTMSGMAVAASRDDSAKGGESEVEMRFSTADAPDRVAAWYRDPARAEGYKLGSIAKEGADFVVNGTQKRDNHPFKIRLSPRAGGGTEGRLTIRHHD